MIWLVFAAIAVAAVFAWLWASERRGMRQLKATFDQQRRDSLPVIEAAQRQFARRHGTTSNDLSEIARKARLSFDDIPTRPGDPKK